jgi:hypothetical protein
MALLNFATITFSGSKKLTGVARLQPKSVSSIRMGGTYFKERHALTESVKQL